ncbi:MAG: VIT1/CCC1 transporter family protein [Candidatus Bathyarchaeia archaeon]
MNLESGRYIILGSVDGILAILGIVLAVSATSTDVRIIISAGFGGAVALAMTNGLGSYMAETAVEYGKLSATESALKSSLKNTSLERFVRNKIFKDSLIHGGCSFIGSLVPLAPFLLLTFENSSFVSVITSIAALAVLGFFASRISKRSLIMSIIKMVGLGVAVALATGLLGIAQT